jgi:hypothetical protein
MSSFIVEESVIYLKILSRLNLIIVYFEYKKDSSGFYPIEFKKVVCLSQF